MAEARQIKPGQVWTAKVSGKETKVEVIGPDSSTPGGRTVFAYKNLETGRVAKGTAGKLKNLVSADPEPTKRTSAHAAPKATPPRAPSSAPPTPDPYAPRPIHGRPKPAPAWARTAWPTRPTHEPAPAPLMNRQDRQAPSPHTAYTPSLPSLRGPHAPRPAAATTRVTAPMHNPSHYPSAIAKSAAEAISNSSARTVEEVVSTIMRWARSERHGGL